MSIKEVFEKFKNKDGSREEVDDFEKEIKEIKEIWKERNQESAGKIPERVQRSSVEDIDKQDKGSKSIHDRGSETSDKLESSPGENPFDSVSEDPDISQVTEKTEDSIKNLREKVKKTEQEFGKGPKEEKKEKGVPKELQKWIQKNLNKGFSPEELKESLKRSNRDPKLVDIYIGKEK